MNDKHVLRKLLVDLLDERFTADKLPAVIESFSDDHKQLHINTKSGTYRVSVTKVTPRKEPKRYMDSQRELVLTD